MTTSVIYGSRRQGKTDALLEGMAEADDPNAICICLNENEAERLHRLSRAIGYEMDRSQFVSARIATDKLRGRQGPVYIDELETVLSIMFGMMQVKAVTLTGEEPSVKLPLTEPEMFEFDDEEEWE